VRVQRASENVFSVAFAPMDTTFSRFRDQTSAVGRGSIAVPCVWLERHGNYINSVSLARMVVSTLRFRWTSVRLWKWRAAASRACAKGILIAFIGSRSARRPPGTLRRSGMESIGMGPGEMVLEAAPPAQRLTTNSS